MLKPSDANNFSLSVSGTVLTKTRDLQEQFSPSQFRDFDDATKLSQPAYVPQDSGVELAGGSNLTSATAITRPVRYDLTVIDAESEPARNRYFPHLRGVFTTFLRANSAAQSKLSSAYRAQTRPYPDAVAVSTETFAVAFQSSNKVAHAQAAAFTSQASAQDYIAKAVAADPSLRKAACASAIRGGSVSSNPPPIADPNDLLGTYSFLPWLRQGVANAIAAPPAGPRASIQVDLQLAANPVVAGPQLTAPITQSIELYGPGDIIGVDSRVIVRTEPRQFVTNFESNYLAACDLLRRGLLLAHRRRPHRD